MRSLFLMFVFTLVTVGCNKEVTDPVPPLTATVTITSTNRFDDEVTLVRVGGTVTWQFQGTHSVKFVTKTGAPNDIPESQNGASISRTFPTAGSFQYSCDVTGHTEIGFINVVITQ